MTEQNSPTDSTDNTVAAGSDSQDIQRRAAWFNQTNMLTTATQLNSLVKESTEAMQKAYPADWYERDGIRLCQIVLMLSAMLAWVLFDRVNQGEQNTYGDAIFYLTLTAWSLSVMVCILPFALFDRLPHMPRWAHEKCEVDRDTEELLREMAKAEWLFGQDLCEHLKSLPMDGRRLYWSGHFTRLHVVRLRNGVRLRA